MPSDLAQILLVDDAGGDRDALARGLSASGYCVRAVGDGTTCFTALREEQARLILLGESLAAGRGLELLRELRRTWSGEHVPVIVIGDVADSAARIAALEGGANDYVCR